MTSSIDYKTVFARLDAVKAAKREKAEQIKSGVKRGTYNKAQKTDEQIAEQKQKAIDSRTKYNLKNKEKLAAYQKAYVQKNKEKLAAGKLYGEAHPKEQELSLIHI